LVYRHSAQQAGYLASACPAEKAQKPVNAAQFLRFYLGRDCVCISIY